MEFTIRGVTFDIDLVNNWVREEYQDLVDLIHALVSMPELLEDLAKEAESATKEEEKDLLLKVKGIDLKCRALKRKIIDSRREIVKELLESNDIVYDESFWLRKCDVDDINNFMLSCVQKDIKKEGKTSSKK